MKKLLKIYLSSFIFLIIITFILTILFYNNKINTDYKTIFKISRYFGFLLFLFIGFVSSNIYQKKGLIYSLLYGLLLIIFLILLNILIFETFDFKKGIYYVLYLISGLFGGLLGVNFKKIF